MGRKANILEGIWKHIEKRGPEDCWPWTGVIKRYGVYSIKKESFRAHRLVYALMHPGTISLKLQGPFSMDSAVILHRCDNPICCNPDHLFLGTPRDNTQDMIRKGRRLDNAGAKNCHALFTEEQVRAIRRKYRLKEKRVFELAKEYGCNWQTMDDLVKNKSYRNVCQ